MRYLRIAPKVLMFALAGIGCALIVAGVLVSRTDFILLGGSLWAIFTGLLCVGLRFRTSTIITQLSKALKSIRNLEGGKNLDRKVHEVADELSHLRRMILDQHAVSARSVRKLEALIEGRHSELAKSIEKTVARQKIDVVQEVEALHQLERMLKPQFPMPLLGGWAMDPVAMRGLVELVMNRKPRLVVEFGGGTSTLWIAQALKKNGSGRIISFEHVAEFVDVYRSNLELHGVSDIVDVRHAPIEESVFRGEKIYWYALASLADLLSLDDDAEKIDMLIVDGPPGKGSELARYPAFPVLKNMLADGAVVIVDDATRRDERIMVQRWQEEFSGLIGPKKIGRRTQFFEVGKSVEPA